jgi:gliding-associated putative ABC transporter substrate-binding component GldG
MENKKKNNWKQLGLLAIVLVIINFASYFVFHRFDLTNDKRYTLSETTKNIISQVNDPINIDVFLEGNFPLEFKKLQNETKQLLEEFSAENSNINFQFINPLEKEDQRVATMKLFYSKGMVPVNVTLEDKGKQTQEVVFPWAMANYNDKTSKIQLLKNMMGASTEQKVESSVQHLEFAFAEAINKIIKEKQKKIAVIKGNGELDDILMADFLKTIKESYYIGPITLDSVEKQPKKTLDVLSKYDLAIIAKPQEKFSEQEKQVLDQFVMKGGKTIWLVDAVNIEMENLYNKNGETIATAKDLNLTDLFFKYGLRINPQLIKDEQGTPLKLASGNSNNPDEMQLYNWRYAPFIYPSSKNSIVKNIEGIKLEFCSPIEMIDNNIKKTVLLESSKQSKTVGLPNIISLASVTEEPSPNEYLQGGFFPTAVLMEGKFTSTYKNRVLPFKTKNFKPESKNTQMIVIADGDIIKNQLDKGAPLELGFDKWTNYTFGNKEFLLNSVNYLLDDNGLINIRNKEVRLPMLNRQKVYENYTITQLVTVATPILLLALFGIIFTYLRKKKYSS